MLSDPDVPGQEKVSTVMPPREFLDAPYTELPASIGAVPDLMNDYFNLCYSMSNCCMCMALHPFFHLFCNIEFVPADQIRRC